MTFAPTRDAALIRDLIRRAWDRPQMLCEGASLDRIPVLDAAQYWVGFRDGAAVALFIGVQQSPVCVDMHVCITPECRGREAVELIRAGLAWLAAHTQYRKVIGSIPAYNRPMLYVAKAAGFTILGTNRDSTMRNGQLADQIIVERRLA